MKKFNTVEDYLEIIVGHRDPITGNVKSSSSMLGFISGFSFEPAISLARYDVNVLSTMTNTTVSKDPLTERQGELACKIILKYERQLAKIGVDVSPVNNPVWRVPLRRMDYSQSISIKDDVIIVKFPFNTTLIDEIKKFAKDSQGSSVWSPSNKVWEVALTEYNLSWLVTWGVKNGFNIDDRAKLIMDDIVNVESSDYKIELYIDNNRLNIKNADPSLIDYITENQGGFSIDNLIHLVDMSAVCGFTVSDEIDAIVTNLYNLQQLNLIKNREIKAKPTTMQQIDTVTSIIRYAEETKRYPVVIYEPDSSGKLLKLIKDIVPAEDIYENRANKKALSDDEIKKFIHTIVPLWSIKKIPLLVSTAGMVFGGDKQFMIQRAEKIVYNAQDVYTSKKSFRSLNSL